MRDYHCISNRCIVICRVSKRISWTRRTFWEIFCVADCISNHFMKIWILSIFAIFFHQFQQMLVVGLLRCRWMIWRLKMVILNVLVQFSLYLNHFEQLEANISSKRLWPHRTKKAPNCKNRVHPLRKQNLPPPPPNKKNMIMGKRSHFFFTFFFFKLHQNVTKL